MSRGGGVWRYRGESGEWGVILNILARMCYAMPGGNSENVGGSGGVEEEEKKRKKIQSEELE